MVSLVCYHGDIRCVNMVTLVVDVFWLGNEFFHVTSTALGWGGVNFGEGGRFFS